MKLIKFFLPICVWNDGASADISHIYLPDIDGSTDFNTIQLLFAGADCKINNIENKITKIW